MPRVLIIEPDRPTAEAYAKALFAAGFEVSLSQTAQSALQLIDVSKPDIIVLDLQLASHDGLEFLHEFSSYADWQVIPIIINSYLPPEKVALLQRDFPVAAAIYKPKLTLQGLTRLIRQTLSRESKTT